MLKFILSFLKNILRLFVNVFQSKFKQLLYHTGEDSSERTRRKKQVNRRIKQRSDGKWKTENKKK